MQDFFVTFFYQPLLNLLVFIYNLVPGHDLGIAIILLTLLVRAILLPLAWKQMEAQKQLSELQPLLQELKGKHKDDRQAFARAQMELFQERKVNPLASCLPLLVQFPFLIALFYVFQNGIESKDFNLLYPFVQNPGVLHHTFLNVFSLTDKGNIILAVLVAGSQYIQTKMLLPSLASKPKAERSTEEDFSRAMNTQMLYLMPVLIGYMSYTFPSGLGLYWFVQTLAAIAQQIYFLKKFPSPKKV